ncbi:Peptidase inhibitor I78 family protein [Loktanella sp. DSM 29012]|uniref:I78 family peptidase inhibitor n=1 Tax=Loktanella sp. DSM 29012 TaxID=1881056 RepID=UPI0008AAE3A9|nr:I78 family peptidase inhibitor [Loktanella sp. DSM 29012]SEQ43385.1 Peptidase inhibitor I78 family protein [Loktanella sp. DSM 29012]
MRIIWTLPLLALMACGGSPRGVAPQAQTAVDNPVPMGVDNSCGGRRYGSLVGKDATVLETVLILGPVQVIRPGGITAQDYQPDRINFIVGGDGTITQITCG